MFVGPPGDAGLAQLDGDLGAVGVVVKQLQRVWKQTAAHLMRQPGGERSGGQGAGRDLTVEHAVGDGAARRDGLGVVVVVGGALLTGILQGEIGRGQRRTAGVTRRSEVNPGTMREAVSPFSWLSSRDLT